MKMQKKAGYGMPAKTKKAATKTSAVAMVVKKKTKAAKKK